MNTQIIKTIEKYVGPVIIAFTCGFITGRKLKNRPVQIEEPVEAEFIEE